MSDKKKTHRINALLSSEVFDDLQRIAAEKNVTLTQIIKHAISLEKWFFEAQKSGSRLVVERDDDLFEVVIHY